MRGLSPASPAEGEPGSGVRSGAETRPALLGSGVDNVMRFPGSQGLKARALIKVVLQLINPHSLLIAGGQGHRPGVLTDGDTTCAALGQRLCCELSEPVQKAVQGVGFQEQRLQLRQRRTIRRSRQL